LAHQQFISFLQKILLFLQVYPVPPEMIQKTRSWLLSRKNEPERAFHVDPKSLDHFGGAPADVTNAYIVWSLTYAKLKDGLDSQASAPSSLLQSAVPDVFRLGHRHTASNS
jgi:hypothetical protein